MENMTPQHMVALGELLSTKSPSELDTMRVRAMRYIRKHQNHVSPSALRLVNRMFEEAFPGAQIPELPIDSLVDTNPRSKTHGGNLYTTYRKLKGYPWYIKIAAGILVYLIVIAGVAAADKIEKTLNKPPVDDATDIEFYANLAKALNLDNTTEFARWVKVLIMSTKIINIPVNNADEIRLAKSFVINMIDSRHKLDPNMLVFHYIGEINDQYVTSKYLTQINNVKAYLSALSNANATYDLLRSSFISEGKYMADQLGLAEESCTEIFANYARKKHEYLIMCKVSALGDIPAYPLAVVPHIEPPRSEKEQKAWHIAGKKIRKFFAARPGLSEVLDLIIAPAEQDELNFTRHPTVDNAMKWAGSEFYASYIMRLLVNDFNIIPIY
jgi:hypothetical protein